MSSTKYFQHGDLPRTHLDFLDPADLTPFTFDGNGTQRDAITAKDKMIMQMDTRLERTSESTQLGSTARSQRTTGTEQTKSLQIAQHLNIF
jgi:hypothetical protein